MIKQADLSELSENVYHGSPKNSEGIAFGDEGNTAINVGEGSPFFVTDDLGYATYFARGGLVSCFKHSFSKVADLFDENTQVFLLEVYNDCPKQGPWDEMIWGEVSESPYELLESPAVREMLAKEGFDAVLIPEDTEHNVTSLAVLSAEKLMLLNVEPAVEYEGSMFSPGW